MIVVAKRRISLLYSYEKEKRTIVFPRFFVKSIWPASPSNLDLFLEIFMEEAEVIGNHVGLPLNLLAVDLKKMHS